MARVALFVLLLIAGLALAGGLADAFGLTVFAPEVPAILTAQLAWSGVTMPLGVGLAVLAGYVQDLDAGGVTGLGALAYGVGFVVLARLARRFAVPGAVGRLVVCAAFVAFVDLVVLVGMVAALPSVPGRRIWDPHAWDAVAWHVAATALAGPAVWLVAEAAARRVGLDRVTLVPRTGGADR